MDLGKVAVLGGGSWATALAKVVLEGCGCLNWYMRRQDRIEEFKQLGHNPAYLSYTHFDTTKIFFSSDINEIITMSDTLLIVTPSAYLREHLSKVTVPLCDKRFIIATKGIIPGINLPISDYLTQEFEVPAANIAVIGGPSHAEEVAMERLSHLTIGSEDLEYAEEVAKMLRNRYIKTSTTMDILGLEYSAVLKNIYAIMCGICNGLKYGDNFRAVLVTNCIKEMDRFLDMVSPVKRNITDSAYLGDLLVTGYSSFSRNLTFGTLIGKGYDVESAKIQMEMVAEGYFGAKCIYEINQQVKADMPIAEAVYSILYARKSPSQYIRMFLGKLS